MSRLSIWLCEFLPREEKGPLYSIWLALAFTVLVGGWLVWGRAVLGLDDERFITLSGGGSWLLLFGLLGACCTVDLACSAPPPGDLTFLTCTCCGGSLLLPSFVTGFRSFSTMKWCIISVRSFFSWFGEKVCMFNCCLALSSSGIYRTS